MWQLNFLNKTLLVLLCIPSWITVAFSLFCIQKEGESPNDSKSSQRVEATDGRQFFNLIMKIPSEISAVALQGQKKREKKVKSDRYQAAGHFKAHFLNYNK